MKKKYVFIILFICLVGALIYFLYFKKSYENRVVSDTVKVIDQEVDLDNGEEKVVWDNLEKKDIKLSTSLSITKSGIYNLSGSINNGNITIDTTGDVKLIFNNISIKSNDGPAIYVKNANNVLIELASNTSNKLVDGSSYSNLDLDGCIYSKDDLIFQGTGNLDVIGNYMDGIVSTNDIKFISGTYNIKSNGDGIRGKDSVYIVDGNFNIISVNDGIKSTRVEDNTKGFVNIDNGNIVINAGKDGISAETKLIINNGKFNIITGGGSGSLDSAINYRYGGGKNYNGTSCKGLKSVDNLVINNGDFNIDSKDDAIHSNNYFGLVDGNISISSGDDGIHADKEIIIDGGKIIIGKCYEGIEAEDVTVNDGNITIDANDDGINISGGVDGSSAGGRPGENHMPRDGGTLHITDGEFYINALGDGIDSNGKIIVNGGFIFIDGPTNDGNGAIDYDISFDVTGGELIAVGSSWMSQGTSSTSTQNSILFYLDKVYSGKLSILDSDGEVILSHDAKKKYSSVVISSKKILKGEEYSVKIGDKIVASIKVNNIVNVYGDVRSTGVPGRR